MILKLDPTPGFKPLIILILSISHCHCGGYLDNVELCADGFHKSFTERNNRTVIQLIRNGSFTSENYPRQYPLKHCRYDFVAAPNERILISFTEFNLYHPEDPGSKQQSGVRTEHDCAGADTLSIFDNINGKLARIDDYCGSLLPLSVMSSGSKLTIEFKAQYSSVYASGFVGKFEFVRDFGIKAGRQKPTDKFPCTFVFNSSETTNGTFNSPNYPGLYPGNTECHFLFYGKDDEYVELYFTYFHIDGIQPCDEDSYSDYVEFSNYMPVDRKFDRQCGTVKGLKMQSDRKFFRMTFRSNDRYDATGFYATYQFSNIANHVTVRNVRTSGSKSFRSSMAITAAAILMKKTLLQ